jgi:cytoskeletal protein CcmA (bactofilin family)
MMVDPNGGANGRKTLVEEGTQFKGSLSSSCPIEVNGRFEGDLTAPALVVNPGGAVQGKVRVSELESQGELAGDFDADVVRLSGTVKDNTVIRAKSLEVKLTATKGAMQVIFAECAVAVGDEQPQEVEAKDQPVARRSSERPRKAGARPTQEEVAPSKAE